MSDDEYEVVNPTTGARKGQKSCRMDLVPVRPLRALATHYGAGARKYEDRNWEKGSNWSLNYAALMRHITAWWGGQDVDEEGLSHLGAVAFHVFALIEYTTTHPELDDRPAVVQDKHDLALALKRSWDEGMKRNQDESKEFPWASALQRTGGEVVVKLDGFANDDDEFQRLLAQEATVEAAWWDSEKGDALLEKVQRTYSDDPAETFAEDLAHVKPNIEGSVWTEHLEVPEWRDSVTINQNPRHSVGGFRVLAADETPLEMRRNPNSAAGPDY